MAIYSRNEQGQLEEVIFPTLKGEDGITPEITIGEVTTLEAGEQATVKNVGTKENPILNFGIPKGEDREDGKAILNIVDGTLKLTNDKWQYVEMQDETTIVLPDVEDFTEIHLFFDTTSELTLILPNITWRNEPNIIRLQNYEVIFKYINNQWYGDVQSFPKENSPITDGLICWLDMDDYIIGESKWRDRSGNGNDFDVVGELALEEDGLFTDGVASYVYSDIFRLNNYTTQFSYNRNGMYINTSNYNNVANLFFIEGNNSITLGDNYTTKESISQEAFNLTFSYDMDYMLSSVYENGRALNKKQTTKISSLTSMRFCFGKKTWEEKFAKTKVNKILIYNRPLTIEEIKHNQLYLSE